MIEINFTYLLYCTIHSLSSAIHEKMKRWDVFEIQILLNHCFQVLSMHFFPFFLQIQKKEKITWKIYKTTDFGKYGYGGGCNSLFIGFASLFHYGSNSSTLPNIEFDNCHINTTIETLQQANQTTLQMDPKYQIYQNSKSLT